MTNTVMNEDDDGPAPSWRQRPKPVGFEIAYKLNGDTLEVDRTRRVDSIRLSAVEQVRFVYAPGNISSKGYKTQLRLSDGRTVTFGNLSWRSLTDLDRDDPRPLTGEGEGDAEAYTLAGSGDDRDAVLESTHGLFPSLQRRSRTCETCVAAMRSRSRS